MKYLRLYIDCLKWSSHVHHLSLHLARYTGLIYRIGDFVPQQTLCMLYYSSIYSRIQYGLLIWGTAAKSQLNELMIRLNNVMRTITYSSKYCPMTVLYKTLNFLKLSDIYKLELGKFMYQLHHDKLPEMLYDSLVKIDEVHDHNTRQLQKQVYYKPSIRKCIASKLIIHRGSKLWGEIDDSIKDLSWNCFKKHYKKTLVNFYDLISGDKLLPHSFNCSKISYQWYCIVKCFLSSFVLVCFSLFCPLCSFFALP